MLMTKNQKFAATRRSMRVSQGRIARRVGLSQTLISQFEIGNLELRPEQVEQLEDALRQELAQVARDAAQVANLYQRA